MVQIQSQKCYIVDDNVRSIDFSSQVDLTLNAVHVYVKRSKHSYQASNYISL